MSNELDNVNVILVVFAMPGCPACEDYLPRFKRQVAGFQRLGHRFEYYAPGARLARRTIPIVIYDATSPDEGIQALADQHGITGMPTTLFMTRHEGVSKLEGGLEDAEIYRLLVAATQANR